MHGPGDSKSVVSADELAELAKLFVRSEGAPIPFSDKAKHAKHQFDLLTQKIYLERVQPKAAQLVFCKML